MGQKNYRTATIVVKGNPVETLHREVGESYQDFVKRADNAARHNKGEVLEKYQPKGKEPVTE
jgi:hypothetical protein